MKYCVEDGNEVINRLKSQGINCELMGSIKRNGESDHDIDVLITDPDTKEIRDKILQALSPKKTINTDWEGIYCLTEEFGDVDIFFTEPGHPKVSVIMSVYNEKKYLLEAIHSILNQTLTDFEFIIIDDGSDESVRKVINTFTDSRIKLIRNEENLGLTVSLNKGLLVATGEYIARQDADDVSELPRLKIQADCLDRHPEIGVLGTSCTVINEIGDEIDEWEGVLNPMGLLKTGNRLCHGSVMFRRDIVSDIGLYDTRFKYAQDYEYWLRISKKYQIRNMVNRLYQARNHDESITAHKTKEQTRYAIFAQRVATGNNEYPHEFCMTRQEKIRYHNQLAYFYIQANKMSAADHEINEIFKLDPLNLINLVRIFVGSIWGRDGIISVQNWYRKNRQNKYRPD